jgi:release factor glutamine methyltransferase
LALEVGIGQSDKVRDLLRSSGFEDIKTYRDLSKIERVVTGVKE